MIELLIVIAIIGVLSSMVLSVLNSARQKARNATRLSGIRTLQMAFNLSLTGSGSLPNTSGVDFCVSATCYDGWIGIPTNPTVDAFLAPSLSQKPSDPTGGNRGYGGYIYVNPYTVLTITGAYLRYTMEPPSSCGPGVVFASWPNYIDCFLKID